MAAVKARVAEIVVDPAMADLIGAAIDEELAPKQNDIAMTFIEPSCELGDTLDFSRKRMKNAIRQGYTDFVKTMRAAERLTDVEVTMLQAIPIFAPAAT